MFVQIVRIESEKQNGEPHPMIPWKKIKDASKGNGEKLNRANFLCIYILI